MSCRASCSVFGAATRLASLGAIRMSQLMCRTSSVMSPKSPRMSPKSSIMSQKSPMMRRISPAMIPKSPIISQKRHIMRHTRHIFRQMSSVRRQQSPTIRRVVHDSMAVYKYIVNIYIHHMYIIFSRAIRRAPRVSCIPDLEVVGKMGRSM